MSAAQGSTTWSFLPVFFIAWLLALTVEGILLDQDRKRNAASEPASAEAVGKTAGSPPELSAGDHRQPHRSPPQAEATPRPVPKPSGAEQVEVVGVEAHAPDFPERMRGRPDEAEILAQVDALFPMPIIRPLMEIVDDWEHVPESAYPKTVTIRAAVDIKVIRDGVGIGNSKMPAGSLVVPRDLVDGILSVSASDEGSAIGKVQVEQTDFKERVRKRYELYSNERTERVVARRATERDRLLKAAALERELGDYNMGDDARFEAVKESLRSGDAGFFELEAASKWRWAGKESVAGIDYETAYVLMVSESAFGTAEHEIKALIQDGRVAKWIDVESGEEL